MLGLEEGAWRTTGKVSAGVEVAGSRQEVQWLEAAGRRHQQEAVAAAVQAVEAATLVPMVETAAGGWKEGGQLPWEAASRVQPEGAASLVGRQEGKGAASAAGEV